MDRYNLNFGFSKVERRFCCGGTREKHKLISDGWDSCWEDKMYSR